MLRTFALLLIIAPIALAQDTRPALPPIPPDQLDAMYRRELGKLYNRDTSPALPRAHALLEQYFAETTPAARKEIVAALEQTGLDANLLGRLCRLRMNWPALESGVYYINERVGPHAVLYFVGVPKNYDRTRSWPMLIKLAGAHAFVTDPRPSADEVARIYTDWIKRELEKHPDAIVLMPLLNFDELYGPSTPGMNTVIQPMLHVASRLNVDPARVYLMGQGMAAHATWNLGVHYPTYFSGVNPLAGGMAGAWQKIRLQNLRNVYCVVWHDENDTVIKVSASRDIVKILRQFKFDVDYEETKGIGHAPTDELAERMYQKLRARSRELYPKELNLASNRRETLFNRSDWVQVYQMLNPGEDQRMRFQKGSGLVTMYGNSYSLAGAITGPNRLEVKSQNVEAMRIYLNDQMVDFAKAVTVIVNGKSRFEDRVKPSIDEMLKDQLFLGRGWRYVGAIVDIDFGTPTTQPATKPATKPVAPK